MNLERQLRSANKVLSKYIPTPSDPTAPIVAPSHPYLQWCFSDPDQYDHISPPCWFISHSLDLDGNLQYDYLCSCGVNKSIHTPDCHSMIIPKIRMTKVKSAPTLDNVWVLCRWIPPPPKHTWEDLYGTLDNYPNNGRYIPVAVNGRTITLPKEHPPFPETSEMVIRQFKAHDLEHRQVELESNAQRDKRDWTQPHYVTKSGTLRPDTWERPPVGSKFDQYRDHFKDKMMEYGQIPGKKQHVSFGGTTTPTPIDTKSSIDIVVVKD